MRRMNLKGDTDIIPNAMRRTAVQMQYAGRMEGIEELCKVGKPSRTKENILKIDIKYLCKNVAHLSPIKYEFDSIFIDRIKDIVEDLDKLHYQLNTSANKTDDLFREWGRELEYTKRYININLDGVKIEQGEKCEELKDNMTNLVRGVVGAIEDYWLPNSRPISIENELKDLADIITLIESKIGCDEDLWKSYVKRLYGKLNLIDEFAKGVSLFEIFNDLPEVYMEIITGKRVLTEEGRREFVEGNIKLISSIIRGLK